MVEQYLIELAIFGFCPQEMRKSFSIIQINETTCLILFFFCFMVDTQSMTEAAWCYECVKEGGFFELLLSLKTENIIMACKA